MNILVTNGSTRLSRHLADALSADHAVTLTDTADVSTGLRIVRSDLGHDASTNALVRGMDAVVLSGEVDPRVSVSDQIDGQTRRLYNLLWAAWEEGVRRVVYLSSLGLMDGYEESYIVSERWRPLPTPEPPTLTYHLGEFVCKEFAREHKLSVVCLRLGDIAWEGESGLSALHPSDAVKAVEKAVEWEVFTPKGGVTTKGLPLQDAADETVRNTPTWSVFHVQSTVPGQRYPTDAARKVLGVAL